MTDLNELADRCESGKIDNKLDVLIEIAIFEPDAIYASVNPNAAGTKVIYTRHDGTKQTCWAGDWTMRPSTPSELRARAATPVQVNEVVG